MTTRKDELQRNLAAVRERIADACEAAGRPADAVTLLPVTKTFPATDVDLLAELGCVRVGESRDQEARLKRAECTAALHWHMIGQVQRNKVRQIVQWADVVESLDRTEVADVLSAAAVAADRTIDVLIQVSLGVRPHAGRGGVEMDGRLPVAMHVLDLPSVRLKGVMAVAPLGVEPLLAFGALSEAHRGLVQLVPEATIVSAGMSGDLEAAIACGATQVRVGGALLGNRPALK